MLAGRKLLLADDSITIQKVVALTFADEGLEVLTVSDGNEAINQLQAITPDIVLADAFMPEVNGYEVCRYIKQNAKLKHIPVILLVGSFEPFDEAEARRVGADDILTKPFQSIRRLIEKVGGLLGREPVAEATTAEFPHLQEVAAQPQKLTSEELEITTADTQQLSGAQQHLNEPGSQPAAKAQQSDDRSFEPVGETRLPSTGKQANLRESEITDSPSNELRNESSLDRGDVLLDLGHISRTSAAASDDFVLELDFDQPPSAPELEAATVSGTHSPIEPAFSRPSEASRRVTQSDSTLSTAGIGVSQVAYRQHELPSTGEESAPATDQKFVDTQEWMRESPLSTSDDLQSKGNAGRFGGVPDEPGDVAPATIPTGPVSLDQLSPEVIDAIARCAVEQLSARVVQEIAWEVVPQLAELLIKRKLEENQSQPK
ncbi:response regulator [soil metagenome]